MSRLPRAAGFEHQSTIDQPLMNQHKMLEAVREGIGAMPDGLDQLWFTEAHGAYFFDFTKPIETGSNELG